MPLLLPLGVRARDLEIDLDLGSPMPPEAKFDLSKGFRACSLRRLRGSVLRSESESESGLLEAESGLLDADFPDLPRPADDLPEVVGL